MIGFQNIAIKYKLIAIVMLTCMVALLLVGSVFVVSEWSSLRNNTVTGLTTQSKITADNCKAALTFDDTKAAEETLKALKANDSIVFACVYRKNGEIFASFARTEADKTRLKTALQEQGHKFADGLLTTFEPIVLDNEKIGTVCLRADLHPMYESIKHNAENTIAVMLLAAIAAYIITSRLQRIISGPILSLAKVARDVSEKKDYSTRAPKSTTRLACSLTHSTTCLSKFSIATPSW